MSSMWCSLTWKVQAQSDQASKNSNLSLEAFIIGVRVVIPLFPKAFVNILFSALLFNYNLCNFFIDVFYLEHRYTQNWKTKLIFGRHQWEFIKYTREKMQRNLTTWSDLSDWKLNIPERNPCGHILHKILSFNITIRKRRLSKITFNHLGKTHMH